MILNKNSIIIKIKKIDIQEIMKFIKVIIIFDYFEKEKKKRKKKFEFSNCKFKKKSEELKRFNVNIKHRHFFLQRIEFLISKIMVSIN